MGDVISHVAKARDVCGFSHGDMSAHNILLWRRTQANGTISYASKVCDLMFARCRYEGREWGIWETAGSLNDVDSDGHLRTEDDVMLLSSVRHLIERWSRS
uniref:Uncharacterized protein n=1 Tax=viral metagenome TaxID=1070528 RepID=A0A6C0LXU6_9ZZZZ